MLNQVVLRNLLFPEKEESLVEESTDRQIEHSRVLLQKCIVCQRDGLPIS